MANVQLRQMQGADLAEVERIYESRSGEPPPKSWVRTVARALDEPPEGALAWVATRPELGVIGYVVGEVRSWEFGSKPAGWVIGLAVDREHQGTGVGDALLESLLPNFRRRGVRTIRTMVQRDDVRVLRFFRGAGFIIGPYTELELELPGGDEP